MISAGLDEHGDRLDQCGGPARAGADTAEHLPGLQLGVGSFTGTTLPGVGGVDLLLVVREPPVAAGVGVEPPAALRNPDLRPAALIGGVGDRGDLGGVEGVDQAVFAGQCLQLGGDPGGVRGRSVARGGERVPLGADRGQLGVERGQLGVALLQLGAELRGLGIEGLAGELGGVAGLGSVDGLGIRGGRRAARGRGVVAGGAVLGAGLVGRGLGRVDLSARGSRPARSRTESRHESP